MKNRYPLLAALAMAFFIFTPFENLLAQPTCSNAPVIFCPPSYDNCPGRSTDPSATGTATAQPGSSDCSQPIVTYSDGTPVTGDCAGELTIYRTWRAEDPNNPQLFAECTQVIQLVDDEAPLFISVPSDIETCDETPPDFADPEAIDNCSNPISLSFSDQTVVGDCLTGSTITRTWTATDDCGNSSTASQTIRYDYDPHPPVWHNCPHDIHLTANSDCEAVAYWDPPTVSDNCGVIFQTSNYNPGDVFPSGETIVEYRATDECGSIGFCRFKVVVSGGRSLELHCPDDIVTKCKPGYHGAPVKWQKPTATVIDCDNLDNCTAEPITGYVYMGRYNGSDYYCSRSSADWPTAQANAQSLGGHLAVIGSAGENAFLANLIIANSAWIGLTDAANEGTFEWVNGDPITYTNWYPGQPNNYYGRQDYVEMLYNGLWNDATNTDAKEYIVEIPCQGYNHVRITQVEGPPNGSVFPPGRTKVKYKAVDKDGYVAYCSFYVTVKKFSLDCPDDLTVYCNYGSGGAYAHWDPPTLHTCGGQSGGCTPGQHIPGFIYMGEFDGHHYYCSNFSATWQDAQDYCQSNGGNLASINSSAENSFLANQLITSSAYIGLSDHVNEGTFEWVNGDPVTFTQWYPGQPNNYLDYQDYVELLDNGYWNDQYNDRAKEFIMELPCVDIKQIGGPPNGSWLAKGNHRITYRAYDAYGNHDECSFYVKVKCNQPPVHNYCSTGSQRSYNTWIDRISFGSIRNYSGNDDGYGNYTHMSTHVQTGSTYGIWLYPGIPNGAYYQTFWGVYIDYNNDGDFNDVNEDVGFTYGVNPILEYITIPNNATPGETRMRIMASKRTYPTDPCAILEDGEVEDYTIRISFGAGIQTTESDVSDQLNIISAVPPSILEEGGAPEIFVGTGLRSKSELSLGLDRSTSADWRVYPNPASRVIYLQPAKSLGEAPVVLRLYNSVGTLVQQKAVNSNRANAMELDVSNLSSGVYLVQVIRNGEQLFSERVVCNTGL